MEIRVLDSHTGGEPTRVVWQGWPGSENLTTEERFAQAEEAWKTYGRTLTREPRGSSIMVGAFVWERQEKSIFDVVFFNNKGLLGMCGHGTIGVLETLEYLGLKLPESVTLCTRVGDVVATRDSLGYVRLQNVTSYRHLASVSVEVDGKIYTGDVAFGGNWFYLCSDHGEEISMSNLDRLLQLSRSIMRALAENGVTGRDGAEIDHVELFGPPSSSAADSRNFVLCPGGEYDRSPCGTGTSAKLACLAEDGKLAEGEVWRQESVIGSIFEGSVRRAGPGWSPTIMGRAHMVADCKVLLPQDDPWLWGID